MVTRLQLTRACGFFLLGAAGAAAAPDRFDYHSVRGRQVAVSATGLHEGESLRMQGKSRVQNMAHYGPRWSADAHLLWDGTVGESMETAFRAENTGRYRLEVRLTKAPDYGTFSVHLNDQPLQTGIDLFAPSVDLEKTLNLGEVALQEGAQKLVFKLTGANPNAKRFRETNYLMGLDYLKLTRLDPPNDIPKPPPPSEPTRLNTTLEEMRPVMAEYCYRCHGGKEIKGKVNLKKLVTRQQFLSDIETTRKVSQALALHEMPPDDEKQPGATERARLAALFDSFIDDYLKVNSSLAPLVMRRMNRYEYNNAVRDLLHLKGDVYPLPEKPVRPAQPYFNPALGRFPDQVQAGNRALGKNQIEQHILTGVVPFAIDLQAEHGFNNRGEDLSLSPILLESFLQLGRSIVESPEFDGYTGLADSFFRAPDKLSSDEIQNHIRARLRPFLEQAFRRMPNDGTEERYAAFFTREFARTGSFPQSMKSVVAAILSSPRFVYITESRPDAPPEGPVTAYELATRLSFFLWSSLPDEELLGLARDGRLSKPDILTAQVQRMLENPRSRALAQNFARQWLRLDQLITAVPDFERFERYYARIGCEQWKLGLQSMVEPLLLFESILVEDRSIMLLVDSNYAYRSDELQSWYQDAVPFANRANRNRFNTGTQTYKRRTLNTRREGGVITTAAVLTMTSSPLRTSPIHRGAWVATVILNQPPPPPPDVVPEIEKDDAEFEAKGLTLRQRLKQHQVNPSCVSCHEKIDPLGYALENFDAVGRWRDRYASGLQIDSSGTIFGEHHFSDVVGLKDALLARPEMFTRAFCEHLLSYALGRELVITDQPALDRIVRNVMTDRGKFSTVIQQIAASYPFLHKTSQDQHEQ